MCGGNVQLFFIFILGLSTFSCVDGVTCKRPNVGRYVVSTKDGLSCVALVKEMCVGMKMKNTRFWKRGVNIFRSERKLSTDSPNVCNCNFSGPNNKYGGGPFKHAAIFSSCDSEGIWIYDQWNGSRGVRYRHLRYDQENANGGQNYYTVML